MSTAHRSSRIPPSVLQRSPSEDARVYIYVHTLGSHYSEGIVIVGGKE
jgi:hypothetical protein